MKMKTGEFIALSACTMTLTALGIDIMLPAFGALRVHFGLPADSTAPSQVIVFFFLGQMCQIVFGVLSDRFGRLPVLRVGFPLYIAGGIAAALAPSLGWMLAARFVAGAGASALMTTTIAGVRDRFAGDRMARILSLIFTIFLFTPVVAPFLGLAVLSVASWRAVFGVPPLAALIIFLWSFRLEESLPRARRSTLRWRSTGQSIRGVLQNRTFLRYTGITTLLFAALSAYVASSEYLAGTIYGRPEWFAPIFAGIGLVMAGCTLLNARLSSRYGARRTIRVLLLLYAGVAAGLLLLTFLLGDPPPMALFFTAVGLLMALNLAVEPNSSALAMEPMGDRAGMASAVYGTAFFFIGATLGSVITRFLVGGVWPLVVGFFVIGLVTVALVLGDRRPQ
jgi:DHA1 family bicyclomycin/chloramphenicol resistance-like MFS transporter